MDASDQPDALDGTELRAAVAAARAHAAAPAPAREPAPQRALARALEPLWGEPLELPDELVRQFPELAAVRFRRGGLPPRVGGWALLQRSAAAITLWRTVFLAPETPLDPALLLHEYRHVQHFAASRWFPFSYVWGSIRRGYHRNPYELDADRFAAGRLGRTPVQASGGAPVAPPASPSPDA